MISCPEDERKAHEYYLQQVRDLQGSQKTAYGEGLDKGLEIGREEGLQEGELKGKLMAAKVMLEMGFDKPTVMARLGLSEPEINGID
ncbi:MAG: hypothetical protein EBX41_00755 [Chitinophagia bacterium]|nr:hypothetical protein [Chitinophagia bacterium]